MAADAAPQLQSQPPAASGWFAVPSPIRHLFKQFPLQVYAAEPLPARAPDRLRDNAKLYVFADDDAALQGLPSFNPTCLKWQTYLRIANLQVDLVPSNNHASPSGSLPYLLPASSDSRPDIPLAGDRIAQYAQKYCKELRLQDNTSPRMEAYTSLLAQSIRPAWLFTLYISEPNTTLLSRLYLPDSPFLRHPLLHTLRTAATAEVLKTTRRPLLQPELLYADAETAFQSLSILLGDDEWFLGSDGPGLFDAEVFAYTHLILDDGFGWVDDRLRGCLDQFQNLLDHRQRLYSRCWGSS